MFMLISCVLISGRMEMYFFIWWEECNSLYLVSYVILGFSYKLVIFGWFSDINCLKLYVFSVDY